MGVRWVLPWYSRMGIQEKHFGSEKTARCSFRNILSTSKNLKLTNMAPAKRGYRSTDFREDMLLSQPQPLREIGDGLENYRVLKCLRVQEPNWEPTPLHDWSHLMKAPGDTNLQALFNISDASGYEPQPSPRIFDRLSYGSPPLSHSASLDALDDSNEIVCCGSRGINWKGALPSITAAAGAQSFQSKVSQSLFGTTSTSWHPTDFPKGSYISATSTASSSASSPPFVLGSCDGFHQVNIHDEWTGGDDEPNLTDGNACSKDPLSADTDYDAINERCGCSASICPFC